MSNRPEAGYYQDPPRNIKRRFRFWFEFTIFIIGFVPTLFWAVLLLSGQAENERRATVLLLQFGWPALAFGFLAFIHRGDRRA